MKKAIAYLRVSTAQQGRSGLGLEAQESTVTGFAATNDFEITAIYIEVVSGKNKKRPKLLKALKECKQQNATLLVAKLDRLGRNVAYVTALMESRIEIIACDYPKAETLILHMLAAFAQHERKEIVSRTIAALAAAKRRGVQLGKYGKYVLSKHNKEKADAFALKIKPIIKGYQQEGFCTVRALAQRLNEDKIKTYSRRRTKWHKTTVHNLMKRISLLEQNENQKPINNETIFFENLPVMDLRYHHDSPIISPATTGNAHQQKHFGYGEIGFKQTNYHLQNPVYGQQIRPYNYGFNQPQESRAG